MNNLEYELRRAQSIQQQYLPKSGVIGGVNLDFSFEASSFVSGDYLDVVRLADGRVYLSVADVSGKGLPASLHASSIHAAAQACLTMGGDLADVFNFLTMYLRTVMAEGTFITMVGVVVHPDTGAVEVLNAGHPPAILLHRNGAVTLMESTPYSPLGVEEDQFTSTGFTLHRGDCVLLYSDGNTDAAGLTVEQLCEIVTQIGIDQPTPVQLVHELNERIQQHCQVAYGDSPAEFKTLPDDQTILAWKLA